MPVAAGPQAYQSQFPSFKSVFRVDSSCLEDVSSIGSLDEKLLASNDNSTIVSPAVEYLHEVSVSPILPSHIHREPLTSDSADSSPTTTVSTTDSSLTDPSPASSPESPVTVLPLSSFTTTNFSMHKLDHLSMTDKLIAERRIPLSLERPMTSPGPRRPRNAKGLALNLPSLSGSVSPEQTNCSVPTSPSFVKPPTMKPRKKPSILSLQTTAGSRATRFTLDPPSTPGGGSSNPMLRHHHSSPQMMFSPSLAPEGGMQLPAFERSKISGLSSTFRRPTGLSKSSSMNDGFVIEEEDFIKPQMATRSNADIGGDPFDKPPGSQEMDSHFNDYCNGPVLMHAPSVYLYKEPTATEAMDFDVVINVAAEVRNPFEAPIPEQKRRSTVPKFSFDPREIDRDNIPEPGTATSIATFHSAFEWLPDAEPRQSGSSTTPKPSVQRPEYIHVQWEHSSAIAKDLMGLCELIDQRTKEGKKVLVHCLQGISRSASLIIAYGIYQNPNMSVTEAHEAAKEKSEWITPNMKLIFQIQDFKKNLLLAKSSSGGSTFKRLTGRDPSRHRNTLSVDVDASSREPLTAPLPSDKNKCRDVAQSPSRPRGLSTPHLSIYSPGPSSAPSAYGWSKDLEKLPTFGLWPLGNAPLSAAGSNIEPASFSFKFGSNPGGGTTLDAAPGGPQLNEETEIDKPASYFPHVETGNRKPSFAAFDFGFDTKIQLNQESKRESVGLGHTVPQELDALRSREDYHRFDSPALPGSFPQSPDSESSQFRTSQMGFGFFGSLGFGSHRKNRANISTLTGSSRDAPAESQADNSVPARFSMTSVTDSPPSPGLWSPRTRESAAHPIADAFAIQQSRAEGPKKDGLSMYGMTSPRLGGFPATAFDVPSKIVDKQEVVSSLGFAPLDRSFAVGTINLDGRNGRPHERSVNDTM